MYIASTPKVKTCCITIKFHYQRWFQNFFLINKQLDFKQYIIVKTGARYNIEWWRLTLKYVINKWKSHKSTYTNMIFGGHLWKNEVNVPGTRFCRTMLLWYCVHKLTKQQSCRRLWDIDTNAGSLMGPKIV